MSSTDKTLRGNASQFFVAGELCRRGLSAVVTLGNTPNVDILCSNLNGTRFAHIQVKTFVPGNRTCSVGIKAEKDNGDNFFWVLGGIPKPEAKIQKFIYYIIPSKEMARNVGRSHQQWLSGEPLRGSSRQDLTMRTVHLPPFKSETSWDLEPFYDAWHLIVDPLKAE